MAKKRANGEGTIFHLRSGKWRVQFTPPIGKRMGDVFNTQKECQDWLVETKASLKKGLDLKGATTRFSDYVKLWFDIRKASLSPNSIDSYQRDLNKVLPFLGHIPIGEINLVKISMLYDHLSESGVSAYTVRKIHKTLSSAFSEAVALKYLNSSPTKGVRLPSYSPKERTSLEANEVDVMLMGAMATNDWHYSLYFTAIQTGMRQGELLGLKWKDVDFEKQEIYVKRQLISWSKGEVVFGPPKSIKGFRTISMGTELSRVLSHHRELIVEKSKTPTWNKYSLVFPASNGVPQNSSNLRRDFRNLIEFTGIPNIRFHDLRHSSATLLLEAGIPITTVSKRLGHSKVSITMDIYSHTTSQMEKQAAIALDRNVDDVAHGLHTD